MFDAICTYFEFFAFSESIVSNSYVKNVWRKAKYAIIDLDNGYSIIWHFGMSGKVKIVDKNLSYKDIIGSPLENLLNTLYSDYTTSYDENELNNDL